MYTHSIYLEDICGIHDSGFYILGHRRGMSRKLLSSDDTQTRGQDIDGIDSPRSSEPSVHQSDIDFIASSDTIGDSSEGANVPGACRFGCPHLRVADVINEIRHIRGKLDLLEKLLR